MWGNHALVHDTVVEVLLAKVHQSATKSFATRNDKTMVLDHVTAKMIITVWELEGERYFTLTFTSTETSAPSLPNSRAQSRQVNKAASTHSKINSGSSASRSSPGSTHSDYGSAHGSNSSSGITSPTSATLSLSPFPPLGPPFKSASASAPSMLQKILMMKDYMLDNSDVPIMGMWNDESLAFPNKGWFLFHHGHLLI